MCQPKPKCGEIRNDDSRTDAHMHCPGVRVAENPRCRHTPAKGSTISPSRRTRGEVPAEVFTTPYRNPVGGNPETDRDNLLEAMRLLEAAGFAVRDYRLVDERTGEPSQVEFLLPAPHEAVGVFNRPENLQGAIDELCRCAGFPRSLERSDKSQTSLPALRLRGVPSLSALDARLRTIH